MLRAAALLLVLFVSVACAGPPARRPRPSVGVWTTAPPVVTPSESPPVGVDDEPPLRPRPLNPFTVADELGRGVAVYPPLPFGLGVEEPARRIVFLHATCMQPWWVCDAFGRAGRDAAWLVCPSGNSTCAGEPDWYGPPDEKAAFLDRALSLVDHAVAPFDDPRPGVLVGWSRGAFAARDVLSSGRFAGRFRALVLVAAAIDLDGKWLRRHGIQRLVVAAGDGDGARPALLRTRDAALAAGVSARWVSLGPIGHVWPADFEARMREPLRWALDD